MHKSVWLMAVIILVSVSCKRDDGSQSVVSDKPAFVVDSLFVSADVQGDTMKGNHHSLYTLKVTYHFEGRPGAIFTIDISIGQDRININNSPSGPIPINKTMTQTRKFKGPSMLTGQDSIFVGITIEGEFWDRNKNIDTTYGSFSNKDSLWVRLQR
jgi:hypothetical protein